MEVKIKKTEYGYYKAECPFCGISCFYREREGKDPLRDLKRHFVNQAKNEALAYMISGGQAAGQHLEYVRQHAKENRPIVSVSKYNFDDDMKVKK